MRDGLSIEGLLLQTQRVLIGRWPWLLGAAVIWGVVLWLTADLPMWLMMNGAMRPETSWFVPRMLVDGVINAAGPAIMIAAAVRLGLPRRPPGVVILHACFAAATVALAQILYGFGGMMLQEVGRLAQGEEGSQPALAAYVAVLLPAIYQFGLFVLLGMTVPAAMERLVSPLAAAKVSLKLTDGHRLWLTIIAVVWTAATLAPVYGMSLLGGQKASTFRAMLLAGQMLTAVGIGVLYLELRRLRAGARPEAAAKAFG